VTQGLQVILLSPWPWWLLLSDPGPPGDVVEPLALEAVLSDSGPPGDVVEPLTLEAFTE
jgi:hypothetical protein